MPARERLFLACRLLNSIAGIAKGIHTSATTRRHIGEVGIVVYHAAIQQLRETKDQRMKANVGAQFDFFVSEAQRLLKDGIRGSEPRPAPECQKLLREMARR